MCVGGGGDPAALRSYPRPFLQGVFLGVGEGHADWAGRWGLLTACLPRLLPKAPKQRRLRQPLPGESWEAVVLSHPASVTSQKPPPRTHPSPAPGDSSVLARPHCRRVRGTSHPL